MEQQASTFKVQWVKAETPLMNLMSLDGEKLLSFIPGQVAVLGIPGIGELYYAIASAPEDKGGMEFLVKKGEGVSKALYEAKPGTQIQVKGPVGKGFPIDKYPNRDFVIAAVGSAIAPMRSVVRSILKRRQQFGKITVIYGARNPEDFAFMKEIGDWGKGNISVIISASKPDAKWTGETGHCETHFEKAVSKLNRPVALICGMKAMQQESRNELVRLGVTAEEVLTNY